MHVELVVPSLFHAQAAAPALQLLLARARRSDGKPATLESWIGAAFGLADAPLPAGALTALAFDMDPADGFWLRADPVHLRADRDRVLIIPSVGFELGIEEATQLCEALNQHFAEQFTLHALAPDCWCLRTGTAMPLQTRPPIEIAGRDIDAELPDKRWHALLNEIQMALYQHGVNTAREARGEPVVNGIWLWGAGPLPSKATGPWQSVSAADPVALGLAKLAGMRHRAPGAGAPAWLECAPEEGRHLLVLDELRGARALGDADALAGRLQSLEKNWFAPLLAALRAGRIGMLTVRVPDAGVCFETVRGDLHRFWRRPRPLANYLQTGEARP